MSKARRICLAYAAWWLCPVHAVLAEPAHFDKLKNALMVLHVRCDSCHSAAGQTTLNQYGKAIGELGEAVPMAERISQLERQPDEMTASQADLAQARNRLDIDGDKVPNWIEVLSASNPADRESVPEPALMQRIINHVDCGLCHEATDVPVSQPDQSRAPHNDFGKQLANFKKKSARARGSRASETIAIMERLEGIGKRDLDRDGVRNWEEVLLFFDPADREDSPTKAQIRSLRRRMHARTSEPGMGLGPHGQ